MKQCPINKDLDCEECRMNFGPKKCGVFSIAADISYLAELLETLKKHAERCREKNKEAIKESYKKWKDANPSYFIIYRKENATTIKRKNQGYRARLRGGGELSKATVQAIYKDNIKHFGALTCYLCLKPIPFGKDHLEHRLPLSRGGTNRYDNLGVACQFCNIQKHNKTVEEYLCKRAS